MIDPEEIRKLLVNGDSIRQWLLSKAPDEIVGNTCKQCFCVLAKFLEDKGFGCVAIGNVFDLTTFQIASPDDPSLQKYWEKRHQKYGKSYWEKNSHNYKIAQTQNWKCPICGEPLFNGEELNTHHIVPVARSGRDDIENLQHLHHACHKQEHSKTKSTRLK